MSLYPLFADLRKRAVLVVGGGAVGERKARALLGAGADVTVGAPRLSPWLQSEVARGAIRHIDAMFAPEWLDATWLVVAVDVIGTLLWAASAVASASASSARAFSSAT